MHGHVNVKFLNTIRCKFCLNKKKTEGLSDMFYAIYDFWWGNRREGDH